MNGKAPLELANQPVLDECLLETWNIYCLIMQGCEAISLKDIKAYCDLYDDKLDEWQIEAILSLDSERQKEWQTQLQS